MVRGTYAKLCTWTNRIEGWLSDDSILLSCCEFSLTAQVFIWNGEAIIFDLVYAHTCILRIFLKHIRTGYNLRALLRSKSCLVAFLMVILPLGSLSLISGDLWLFHWGSVIKGKGITLFIGLWQLIWAQWWTDARPSRLNISKKTYFHIY